MLCRRQILKPKVIDKKKIVFIDSGIYFMKPLMSSHLYICVIKEAEIVAVRIH